MKKTKQTTHPVDHGYAWVILVGCFLMYMFLIGSVKTFGILYTELLEHFQTGAGNTAWISSVSMFLLLSVGPFVNLLSQKVSFRVVTFTAGILICLGYVTSAFVKQMEMMYLTFGIIGGFGYGLGFAPCSTIVSYYFSKRRALANGITVSGSGVGAFLLPYLYRYVINEYGLNGALIIIGGMMLNVCVAASLFRQPFIEDSNTKRRQGNISTENTTPASESLLSQAEINETKNTTEQKYDRHKQDNQFCPKGLNLKLSLFKVPKFSLWLIAFCFLVFGYTANFTMVPSHILALGYDKDKVVIAMSILGISEMFSRILVGWLADLKLFPTKYLFIGSAFISGVAAICVPFFSSFEALAFYSAIVGIFPGTFWSLISVYVIESVGIKNLSPGFGLASLSLAFGVCISQPSVGWIEDATGSWNMSFRVAGIAKLVSGCIVLCQPLMLKFFQKDIQSLDPVEIGVTSENKTVSKELEENDNIPGKTSNSIFNNGTETVALMEPSKHES